tara:strand:+ start:1963 stop:2481 length:519 start_codon:yes stop_codon:yes gene_type:complete
MKDLVHKLQKFAKKEFPSTEVTNFLNNYELIEKDRLKYSHFSKKNYTRNLVFRNKYFEIIILCWSPGQIAPIHGHEGEKCWAKVEVGKLKFCNFNIISKNPLKLKNEKEIIGKKGFLDGPAEIHSVENIYDKNAVSLHIYAKPYDSCNIYDINTKKINRVNLEYHSKFGQLC